MPWRVGLGILVILGTIVPNAGAQWVSMRDTKPAAILFGYWHSCEEPDGSFLERVYEHRQGGRSRFEFHLGPRDEFALFAGSSDRHLPHDSPLNRLSPAYHYNDVPTVAGGRNWAALRLRLNVVRLPSPDTALHCDTFVVELVEDRR